MEIKIVYHDVLDVYSVQIKTRHMGWVTVASYLTGSKAEQIANWLK